MSVPPQIIRVKRKKIEEPLDTLYFETNSDTSHDAKRPFTEYAFKLLQEPEPEQQTGYETSQKLVHQDNREGAKAETPHNDISEGLPCLDTRPVLPLGSSKTGNGISASGENNRSVPPRRFHFSRFGKDSDKILRGHQQDNRIHKQPRSRAPVFTERRNPGSLLKQKLFQDDVSRAQGVQGGPIVGNSSDQDRDEHRWKTPGLRGIPKREQLSPRRAAVKEDKPTIDPSVLQIFAEMQREYEDGLNNDSGRENAQPTPRSRFGPNIPTRRHRDRHTDVAQPAVEDELMDIDGPEESDFVYDTYIRHRTDPPSVEVDRAMLGNGTFGVLVIDEQDQALWDELVDDVQDSDKDWNSEEEDENAEDYYGADYPEEEVDNDDEYDIGAYRYRHNPSDEEEYDSEAGAWSDDDELRHPWKIGGRQRRATHERGSDE
ncbi:hypothetical protein EV356DRAFT_537684 [Viridothelium virens]|uniref:Transcription factor Iwr1 domain-containing protein n=1 Tax=Viridothelium virens TaxID=1048519 RepID=A0A6A6GTF5_VIRVR|nr:hypothetical protein EV356DRAFT_537684 [Viridothelium virens]